MVGNRDCLVIHTLWMAIGYQDATELSKARTPADSCELTKCNLQCKKFEMIGFKFRLANYALISRMYRFLYALTQLNDK